MNQALAAAVWPSCKNRQGSRALDAQQRRRARPRRPRRAPGRHARPAV